MMHQLRKSYLTLIEMMIVIALVALVGGLMALNIRSAIQEQKFRTEAALVADTLRLAQDIMLIQGGDVTLLFLQKPDGIQYWMEMDESLSGQWKKQIAKAPKTLSAIHSVSLINSDEAAEPGEIRIRFYSGGTVMTRGKLLLSSGETPESGSYQSSLCLYGFPHPITLQQGKETCVFPEKSQFEEQLTQDTLQQIQRESFHAEGS